MDAYVGHAAAQIAVHGVFDVRVRGIGVVSEKRSRLHNLAGLRRLGFNPCYLKGMTVVGMQAFDRHDFPAGCGRQWRDAGACCLAIKMDGTGAAHPDAAAELCPGHV